MTRWLLADRAGHVHELDAADLRALLAVHKIRGGELRVEHVLDLVLHRVDNLGVQVARTVGELLRAVLELDGAVGERLAARVDLRQAVGQRCRAAFERRSLGVEELQSVVELARAASQGCRAGGERLGAGLEVVGSVGDGGRA